MSLANRVSCALVIGIGRNVDYPLCFNVVVCRGGCVGCGRGSGSSSCCYCWGVHVHVVVGVSAATIFSIYVPTNTAAFIHVSFFVQQSIKFGYLSIFDFVVLGIPDSIKK